jgi:hypothetical protein
MSATIKVICYKSKKLSNDEYLLMLRVTKDRKRKYVSLGISALLIKYILLSLQKKRYELS